jgi:membrane-associated phospholipid phosphatase
LCRDPQPWLERWLERTDHAVFIRLGVNRTLRAAPRWMLELLEASYTADYVVVAAGALIAASAGVGAISRYWTIVLAAELACYGALPFLRSRPPRALEVPGVMAQRAPRLRWLNTAILDRASVQANTIPSGHVAGAVAAALAVMAVSTTAGWILMGIAMAIAASAVAGRYHYAVDCVLGAAVAVVVSLAL